MTEDTQLRIHAMFLIHAVAFPQTVGRVCVHPEIGAVLSGRLVMNGETNLVVVLLNFQSSDDTWDALAKALPA
jgi:hypothetical protein